MRPTTLVWERRHGQGRIDRRRRGRHQRLVRPGAGARRLQGGSRRAQYGQARGADGRDRRPGVALRRHRGRRGRTSVRGGRRSSSARSRSCTTTRASAPTALWSISTLPKCGRPSWSPRSAAFWWRSRRRGACFARAAARSCSPARRPASRATRSSASFAMGKFALRGLAQSMARELAPQNIHVAHFVIDGAVRSARRQEPADRPDSMLDPDAIAADLPRRPQAAAQRLDLGGRAPPLGRDVLTPDPPGRSIQLPGPSMVACGYSRAEQRPR